MGGSGNPRPLHLPDRGTCRPSARDRRDHSHGEIGDAHVLQRWLADIRRLPRVTEMEVGPLDHEATARQTAALLGQVPHTTLVDDVHAHSGGNPYFNRLIVQGLPPAARRIDPELPRDLRAAVLGAWELSSPARDATTILAVAGGPLSSADLALVSAGQEPGMSSALIEASDGIVERRPSGDFWFRHPLTPEVLEEALPRADEAAPARPLSPLSWRRAGRTVMCERSRRSPTTGAGEDRRPPPFARPCTPPTWPSAPEPGGMLCACSHAPLSCSHPTTSCSCRPGGAVVARAVRPACNGRTSSAPKA